MPSGTGDEGAELCPVVPVDQLAEEGKHGDREGVRHEEMDGALELASHGVGLHEAGRVKFAQEVDVIDVVADFREDDADEERQRQPQHAPQGRIGQVDAWMEPAQLVAQSDQMGQQLQHAARDEAPDQHLDAEAQQAHSQD